MRPDARNADTIFAQAIEIASPQERAAFLENACANDPELRREVEKLVADYFRAGGFLERPVAHIVGTVDQPLTESPGSRIGPFKLLQKLGEGGMGTVWVAEQTEPVKRRGALKVIKPGMDSRQVLRRFEAERQALALMDHTHIAKVFDAGTTAEGRPYFVMELVKGAPITKYCDELHLPIRERLELFVPVCQAIQHAHQKGIIHRDIKPSNILVAIQDGKPVAKVIDFGVAKALHQRLTEESVYTEIGQVVGTLEYMSPEQAELSVLDIDTRADIYALGAVLYELLTGSTPLDRKRLHNAALAETLRLIKEEEPPKPSTRLTQSKESLASLAAQRRTEPAKLTKAVRGELDWIVMKCLEKDRTRRYDTANSLARDVERYLHDEPVEACPPSVRYRLRKFARKYRMPVTVAAAFVLLLTAGVVVSTWQVVRATRAESEAVLQADVAKVAEREATKKRQEAEAAQEQARKAEARMQRLYYAASMGLVQEAWESRNLPSFDDLLAKTADFAERGFEWYYWQRLCHIELLTLLGHKGGITAVAFAPDGQRLVTGGTDGTARVWDAATGRQLFCLSDHRSRITAVAFAPDGQWLVTGSTDGTARVWDAAAGRKIRVLQGKNTGPVWAVAVSPDGKRVVTGSEDGKARVWDAVSCLELLTLQKHTGRVWAVAVSPDGRRLVTGSGDRTARVWDVDSGRELLPPLEHTEEVTSVAISANGQLLVTGSGHQTQVNRLVKLWDAASGRYLRSLGEISGMIRSIALSPDGMRVVTGSEDWMVKVWDTAGGRRISILAGHRRWVTCVAFSPDGRRLATGSLDGTARVWDMTGGQGTRTLKGHSGVVRSVAMSPDGQRLATGSLDGTARVWDTATGREPLILPEPTGGVVSIAFTPDGRRIVTGLGNRDGTVEGEGKAMLWDAISGCKLLELQGHTGVFWSVAVSPNGKRVVTGSEDGTVSVWDAVSGRELLTFKAHAGRVWAVAVTPDGQRLVTGGWEGTAKLWDAASGHELLKLKANTGAVTAVAVTPDGQQIVTGGQDGMVRLWNAVSGHELRPFKGHAGFVWSITVTSDGQRIVTGGDDGTARLWDAVSGHELLTLKEHIGRVWSVAMTSDGRQIVAGGDDGTVKIWKAASPEQLAPWAGQAQEAERRMAEAARRLEAWALPAANAPGFIQDWLVLAPLALEPGQTGAEGLEREQLSEEARLQPRAGNGVPGRGREYTWQAYHEKEPVLDFNRLVGKVSEHSVAYAVCYVMSEAKRSDLLLQVGSDDQAKVYLNGEEVYKYSWPRPLAALQGPPLAALDPIGPLALRKGTNVLVFKVVNELEKWQGCARFVDLEGNPAQGLRVSLTPE
jgi:WD40 repeat protein/serine/threonine protein kinase